MARQVWASMQTAKGFETVGDYVTAYLDLLPEGRDEKRKREAWRAAKPFWAGIRPSLVDAEMCLAYEQKRDRSAHTMRHELGLVKRALAWGIREGHLDKAPEVVLPPMPEATVDHLTKAQFRKLLDGCVASHIQLFAMLAVTTGGRKTALLQAKWDQVDLDRAIIDLNPKRRTQNGKYRATVPLNDMILPVLREAKESAMTDYIIEYNGNPCLDIKKGFAAAAQRAGIKAHPHMLRHSAAVWMAEDRVPMGEIAALLGHRNINITTRIYARYHPDHLRSAARSLSW
ncbi:tyrosine-type recombinase/integrase [Croceicoccus marinus]|uniref:tyrosine-type recombinase/integrase n=1 Tax=Croceicoccus marinus TaxID=450378 RepID=UPI001E515949|nr:site-specific integrase [Croceicoccus marinus]